LQITLTSFGTLGDLLPYLALGRVLQARGHKVVLAIAGNMLVHAQRAGLDAVPCYPHHGPEQVKARPEGFDHWPAVLGAADSELDGQAGAGTGHSDWQDRFDLKSRIRDLAAACQNADLLVCHTLVTGEPVAAEIAGVPCLQALVTPERLWHRHFQNFLAQLESGSASSDPMARKHFEWVQRHRMEAGLPVTPPSGWQGYFRPTPALLGASRLFLAPIDTSGWNADVCGFWFYDDPKDCAWAPDRELAAFVERGPAPIVLSFSSLPLVEPDRVLALHVKAARQISRPLVVLRGWSSLAESVSLPNGGDVLMRSFLPHDWLFARAAAVIHHGGIGTLARALRNGCPMLVEPWGNDQFFNALLVLKNGVGAAANPKKLTADELANLLAIKVLSERAKDRVAALAEGIRREDGIGDAVRLIEDYAEERELPAGDG
jgi:UDP:flavonoid glycosyltransferase YjiC (YdhE family)